MKRIARWLAALFRTLSLVAAFGVLGWAARSYISHDSVTFKQRYVVGSSAAQLRISAVTGAGLLELAMDWEARVWQSAEMATLWLEGLRPFKDEMRSLEWEVTLQEHFAWGLPIDFGWDYTSSINGNTGDARIRQFRYQRRFLWLPIWIIAIPLAIPSAVHTICDRRRRRRLKSGQCVNCGYDLCETPERCPECGTPVVAAK